MCWIRKHHHFAPWRFNILYGPDRVWESSHLLLHSFSPLVVLSLSAVPLWKDEHAASWVTDSNKISFFFFYFCKGLQLLLLLRLLNIASHVFVERTKVLKKEELFFNFISENAFVRFTKSVAVRWCRFGEHFMYSSHLCFCLLEDPPLKDKVDICSESPCGLNQAGMICGCSNQQTRVPVEFKMLVLALFI